MTTLYVNYITPDIDNTKLRDIFSAYGRVGRIYIHIDTRKPKYMGYLEMSTKDECEAAIKGLHKTSPNYFFVCYSNKEVNFQPNQPYARRLDVPTMPNSNNQGRNPDDRRSFRSFDRRPFGVNNKEESGECAHCRNRANMVCNICATFYCSLSCQNDDWKKHSLACMPRLVPMSYKSRFTKPRTSYFQNEKNASTCKPRDSDKVSSEAIKKTGPNEILINKMASIKIGTARSGYKQTELAVSDELLAVTLSQIMHPHKIFLQKFDEGDKLIKMTEELQNLDHLELSANFHPSLGDVSLCYDKEESKWRRGLILEKVFIKYHVLFIDIGKEDLVGESDICKLPKKFEEIPAFAFSCSIHNIVPIGDGWTAQANECIVSHVDEVMKAKIIRATEETVLIELSSNDGLVIGNELVKLGHAASFSDVFSIKSVIEAGDLEGNIVLDVCLMENSLSFSAEIKSGSEDLEPLEKDCLELCSSTSNLNPMMLTGAFSPTMNKWCRACISSKVDNNSIMVRYVDSGKEELVTQVALLDEKYLSTPSNLLHCQLMKQPELAFQNGASLFSKVVSVTDGCITLALEGKKDVIIKGYPWYHGFKCTYNAYDDMSDSSLDSPSSRTKPDDDVDDPESEAKENLADEHRTSKLVHKKNMLTKCPEVKESVADEDQSTLELFDKTMLPICPNPIEDETLSFVVHQIYSALFVITKVESLEILDKLAIEMKEFSAKVPPPVKVEEDKLYVAYSENKEAWCRGYVVHTDDDKVNALLFFNDYGTFEEVVISKMRPLPAQFLKLSNQGLKIFLDGIQLLKDKEDEALEEMARLLPAETILQGKVKDVKEDEIAIEIPGIAEALISKGLAQKA